MNRARSEEASCPEYPSQPELAIAALLHLLTRVADKSSPAVTDAISAHLEYVAADQRNAPALRQAARRIAAEWLSSRSSSGQSLH